MKRVHAAVAAMACSLAIGSVAMAQNQAPAPAPSPINLPEIGRVRAITPSCAVMRDLVIPSWQVAQKVDARFVKNAQPRLPKYMRVVDEDATNPERTMLISYLDQQVGLMKEDLTKISDALGDYRLRSPRDSQSALLRDKLQDLYDAESGRANILWEFVTRQRVQQAKDEARALRAQTAPTVNVAAGGNPDTGIGIPGATPVPGQTPEPYAMPHLTGIPLQDERTMTMWGESMTNAVYDTEDSTSRVFTVVANSCH